jgi:hypothetical protein
MRSRTLPPFRDCGVIVLHHVVDRSGDGGIAVDVDAAIVSLDLDRIADQHC